MADYTITATSVVKTANTSINNGIAGGTVTAGQPVYKDSADSNELKAAQANAQATSVVVGIALHGASDGQPLQYATRGDVTFNSAFTVGARVVCSAGAAGGLAPDSDLTTGNYPTTIGIATTATNLKLGILASEVALP